MASINEFIAQVKSEGLARDNRFLVSITPPAALIAESPDTKLRLYCQSVQMPGLNFTSNPVLTYGEQREVIYNRQYEPINIEFLADGKMELKRFFDTWQQLIIDPVTRMVNYYENYIGTIEISQLTSSDNEDESYAVRLFEAFPKVVSPISYTSGSKEVTKLQVSFEFKYWMPLQVQSSQESSIGITNLGSPAFGNLAGGIPGISQNIVGSALDWGYNELDA